MKSIRQVAALFLLAIAAPFLIISMALNQFSIFVAGKQ